METALFMVVGACCLLLTSGLPTSDLGQQEVSIAGEQKDVEANEEKVHDTRMSGKVKSQYFSGRLFQSRSLGYRYSIDISKHYTWHQALYDCAIRGYQLASIDSYAEQAYIKDVVRRDPGLIKYSFWLDGTDAGHDGYWVSTTNGNRRLRYTSWGKGEPNNYRGIREDCLQMAAGWKHDWNDEPCNRRLPFVCKRRLM